MTPAETAKKLLEYFGKRGARWCHGPVRRDVNGRETGHCVNLAPRSNTLCLCDAEINAFSKALIAVTCCAPVYAWNDASDWGTVKAALERVAGLPLEAAT